MSKLELGQVPGDETYQEAVGDNYFPIVTMEVGRYIELLKTCFPEADKYDCHFLPKDIESDSGKYREVTLDYNDLKDESFNFSIFIRENLPLKWDDNKPRYINGWVAPDIGTGHLCGQVTEEELEGRE